MVREIVCPGYNPQLCSLALVQCDCVNPEDDSRFVDCPWDVQAEYDDVHPSPGWHETDPPQCWQATVADVSECDFDPVGDYWAYVHGTHQVDVDPVPGGDIDDPYIDVLLADREADRAA